MKSFNMFGIKFIDEANGTSSVRKQGNVKSFKFYPEQKCIVSINNGNVIGEVKCIVFQKFGNIGKCKFTSFVWIKENALVYHSNSGKFEIEIKKLSFVTSTNSNYYKNFKLATEKEKLMYIKTNMLID